MRVFSTGTGLEAAEKMREHLMLGFQQIMDGLEPYFKMRIADGDTYPRKVKAPLSKDQSLPSLAYAE